MAQGLYKMSPFKFWQALASPAGLSVIGGALGAFGGMKASRRARAEQGRARTAMDASRQRWMEQDLSNPYANMENVYEDLTVNQQAAQFQSQQAAQSRADILSGLQGAAGGAGVAGLAQAMAQQGTIQAQQASASIGQQESMNQRLRAQGAAGVQQYERYGASLEQSMRQERASTLYGMDMQRLTAANEARANAQQQIMSGLGSMAGGVAAMGHAGVFDKTTPDVTVPEFQQTVSTINDYNNDGIDDRFQDAQGNNLYQGPFRTFPKPWGVK